jgi:hypothetical protein
MENNVNEQELFRLIKSSNEITRSNALAEGINFMLKKINLLETQNKEFEHKYYILEQDYIRFKEESSKVISEYEKLVKEKKSEIEDLVYQLKKSDNEIIRKEKEIENLKNEFSKRLNESNKNKSVLQSTIDELKEEINKLEVNNNDLINIINKNEEEYKYSLEEYINKFETERKYLEEQIKEKEKLYLKKLNEQEINSYKITLENINLKQLHTKQTTNNNNNNSSKLSNLNNENDNEINVSHKHSNNNNTNFNINQSALTPIERMSIEEVAAAIKNTETLIKNCSLALKDLEITDPNNSSSKYKFKDIAKDLEDHSEYLLNLKKHYNILYKKINFS